MAKTGQLATGLRLTSQASANSSLRVQRPIGKEAIFSHCLPVRRNVQPTDAVLDAPSCVAIDEAENRLHVLKALMLRLLGVAAG
jgi:ornithine carbamoyltransferase